jgi:SecD/SecF fusion protein
LIFGIMIFIGQPLTLPGLAGLVLTIGMSVDANVLIFERIREEKNKGSAPRMSIRNGFDKAFSTILDSNLTTLIAAIVLYWIGTDQVRGFAVALIIGIATSMFTATFCSRIVFEIAEKLKMASLSMADGVGFLKRSFLGSSDIQFMRMKKVCLSLSLLLIVVGMAAVFIRGSDILNIDFTGGTSVTFQLQEPVAADQLRDVTRDILVKDSEDKPVQSTLVRVEKQPLDTVYTLVTSINDVDFLSQQLIDGFARNNSANLVTYRVKILKEKPTGSATSLLPSQTVRFVSYAQDPAPDGESASPSDVQTADEPTQQVPAEPSASSQETAVTQAGEDEIAQAVPTATVFSEYRLEFGASNDENPDISESDKGAKIDGPTLQSQLQAAAEAVKVEMNAALIEVSPIPRPADWQPEDVSGHSVWAARLPVDDAAATKVVSELERQMQKQPKWLSLSKIGTRVAGEMKQRAVAAILLSLVFIVAYIWFRFQKVAYGLAAVVALVHDVSITLGILALCHWLAKPLGFLLIEDFKIGLTEVAAFLTIIGYSLNDTIVIFDRIREVRGRSPRLTEQMVNDSVNQTLSRTLLTSGTTLLTVILLYVFGGEGIHAFAFALLVGITVGTYSSIFVAAPILVWLSDREMARHQRPGSAS